jgi:D-alanyl-D-alanine carboxypeptidase
MKKFLILFLIITFFTKLSHAADSGCSDVYSYLVFDVNSGEIVSETRSDKVTYPASLVKVMTLYLTFEAIEKGHLKPDQILRISARGEEISRVNKINRLAIKEGDTITVRQAIRAVIVKSFNEAAVTLGEAVAGSEWEFVRKMNEKAKELGMNNTSFRNASGLHEEGQYTTSYDLARLVIAMRKNFSGYYHLFAAKEFEYHGTKYETHNHVLLDYKGAEGLKTGFTNASGFNLISAASKDGRRIVSVLLGCATVAKRDNFTKNLLNAAFIDLESKHRGKVEVKVGKGFNYAANHKDEIYEEEILDLQMR